MERYTAIEEPRRIKAVAGKIYSTSPEVCAVRESDHDFVIKGPGPAITFPEAVAYQLAQLLDVAVPEFGVCHVPGRTPEIYFACRKLRGRFALDFYLSEGHVTNPSVIAETITMDVWLGNFDRNIGNFIEDEHLGGVKIFAIDFEKSGVLRGDPDPFTLTGWNAQRFWPIGDLGLLCRSQAIPWEFCEKVKDVSGEALDGILEQTLLDLNMPDVPWMGSAKRLLRERQGRLDALLREAWHG
jgi:hypothetical protein